VAWLYFGFCTFISIPWHGLNAVKIWCVSKQLWKEKTHSTHRVYRFKQKFKKMFLQIFERQFIIFRQKVYYGGGAREQKPNSQPHPKVWNTNQRKK